MIKEETRNKYIKLLKDARDELGHTPSMREFDELDIGIKSTTIEKYMGGWNKAKKEAGLRLLGSGDRNNTEIKPKPEDVEIPEDKNWEELTSHQRWYYKNKDYYRKRKNNRKKKIREWYRNLKSEKSCKRCGEDHPATLEFHHPEGREGLTVGKMVSLGYSKEKIKKEIDKCEVLCSNCHKILHYNQGDNSQLF